MSFRRNKSSFEEAPSEAGDGWIWGNHRGGGGAPVKDVDGNTVSNLKALMKASDGHRGGRRDPSPPDYYDSPKKKGNRGMAPLRRNTYDDDDDDYREPVRSRRSNNGADYYGGGSGNNGRKIPGLSDEPVVSPQGSPKKFMSALQEMNSSVSNSEQQAKKKKELDYQEALRRQIEENRRKKEEEKRKDDEVKRREYEEFMRMNNRGGNSKSGGGDHGSTGGGTAEYKKRPVFKGDEIDDEDDYPRNGHQRNGGGGGGLQKKKGIPGLDFSPAAVAEDYDLPPKKRGVAPRRGLNDDDDDVDDYAGRGRNSINRGRPEVAPLPVRGGGAARGRGGRDDTDEDMEEDTGYRGKQKRSGKGGDLVSIEQYDELSALCDKLLAQQENLQAEIEQQASIIKDLQRSKAGGKGAPAVVPSLAGGGRSKSAFQQSRASSVERGGGPGGAAAKRQEDTTTAGARAKSQVKQRPNSMYEKKVGDSSSNNQQKKQLKVAFGNSILGNDKKPPIGAASKVNATASSGHGKLGGNSNKSASALASKAGGGGRGVGGGGGREEVTNGFAKLQLKAAKGPQIVTYEDEAPVGRNAPRGGGGRGHMEASMDLELKGQSKYMPIRDEDDYGGGGDQLDLLLTNTRRGRFN